MLGINLFGPRTLWWWRNSPYERKESWSLPDVTLLSHIFLILWVLNTPGWNVGIVRG